MKITSRLLFSKIEKSIELGKPCVCYRMPGRIELRAFFQDNNRIYKSRRFNESGFVFAPFNNEQTAVIIRADKAEFNTARYAPNAINTNAGENSEKDYGINEKIVYTKLIEDCIQYLDSSSTKKIVLSRRLMVDISRGDLMTIYKNLLAIYKEAMVYIWFHPKIGLWMGASPETLLRVNGSIFETMSLAGTKAYSHNKKVKWTYKEKREQKYVTDFIIETISKQVNSLKISRTQTVIAGNVAHRRTNIKGILGAGHTLYGLISKLHPTPAVCGLPQKVAKEYILNNEGYDRKFYTGFLGEINFKGISNLFVNLRCLEVQNEVAYIYVGGGITVDSKAEDEWQETLEKSKVIKKALASS